MRGQHRRLGMGAASALALLGGPLSASAGPSRLVLDAFSFFLYEGSEIAVVLPAGAVVPLELERAGANRWTLRIDPAGLDVPPVRYPSGRSVAWKLARPATGELTVSGGAASCRIDAPLVAYVDGAAQGVPFPLAFSTESAQSQAESLVASAQGVKLDLASGALQLVAAGVSPADAPTAPGKPFYVILSGQILDRPPELAAP